MFFFARISFFIFYYLLFQNKRRYSSFRLFHSNFTLGVRYSISHLFIQQSLSIVGSYMVIFPSVSKTITYCPLINFDPDLNCTRLVVIRAKLMIL